MREKLHTDCNRGQCAPPRVPNPRHNPTIVGATQCKLQRSYGDGTLPLPTLAPLQFIIIDRRTYLRIRALSLIAFIQSRSYLNFLLRQFLMASSLHGIVTEDVTSTQTTLSITGAPLLIQQFPEPPTPPPPSHTRTQ